MLTQLVRPLLAVGLLVTALLFASPSVAVSRNVPSGRVKRMPLPTASPGKVPESSSEYCISSV